MLASVDDATSNLSTPLIKDRRVFSVNKGKRTQKMEETIKG